MVDAVLARLIEIDAKDSAEAMWLLLRLGGDTSPISHDRLLSRLGEGLEQRGMSQLAAVALTLAYTSARDGWRRFAGQESQDLFLRALALDERIAWETLIREVADSVSPGAEFGVTVHLLELLAIGGRVDDAFACWAQGCEVIAYRLPPVGPSDHSPVTYNTAATDPITSLAACLTARLESIDGREEALDGVSILVRHGSDQASRLVAHTLACAVHHASSPVLYDLLRTIDELDAAPFTITTSAAEPLAVLATSDFGPVSTLARTLLTRADLEGPATPTGPP